MARINPKITIRSVYFGMLLLSAAVMILTVRLTIASDLDSLKAAAEQGDADAQFNLGYMYSTGEGVPENDTEAVRWYRMAAEQGDADAQLNLGGMYSTGEGVPENDTEAVRWYRMAAEQGDADAQSNLGYMYATGEGVPENDTEAVRWYRMAAEQGYIDAGEGVPENTEAHGIAWPPSRESRLHVCHRRRRSRKRYRGSAMVSHGRRAGIGQGAVQSRLHV